MHIWSSIRYKNSLTLNTTERESKKNRKYVEEILEPQFHSDRQDLKFKIKKRSHEQLHPSSSPIRNSHVTERERDMLRKCQRKMERKILNITLRHRLRNEDIRSQTHLKDAAETADKLKKKWIGHMMRLNTNRWTYILTTWDLRIGKRNAGRQKTSLLSKNLKVRIYKTVILPVVLCGCETWTLTLREEQRLRAFENKVLRKIFGAKRDEVTGEWRKLHNTELHPLYSAPDIIRNIKSRRLRWAMHRNAYRVLVGRPEGKRPLGRPRRRWEDNIKMDLREVGYDERMDSFCSG
ncbi:hypothetical protein ANN_19879 [Periplaneta americana]|uniref:Endonuclease-reverse transcriptase n=1 Tax=Periplaneta americana TaxID=6978 RepID=A0ABQ8SBF5_PERAM|nr:hypothetical protein ANN_19879 [Periplaneta americana]